MGILLLFGLYLVFLYIKRHLFINKDISISCAIYFSLYIHHISQHVISTSSSRETKNLRNPQTLEISDRIIRPDAIPLRPDAEASAEKKVGRISIVAAATSPFAAANVDPWKS